MDKSTNSEMLVTYTASSERHSSAKCPHPIRIDSKMKWGDFAMALCIALVWGIAFVAIKIGLNSVPPLIFTAVRFAIASLPLIIFPARPDVGWLWIVLIGLISSACQFSLTFFGIHLGVPAGIASLVLQSHATVFTTLLAIVVFKEVPRPMRIIGLLLAFIGLAGIGISQHAGQVSILGLLAVAAGAFCFAIGNIMTKQSGSSKPLNLVLWTSLIPPLPLIVLSYFVDGPEAIPQVITHLTIPTVLAMVYVGASIVVGFGLWNRLIFKYGPATVAPFALLVPIIGMASTSLFLGESLKLIDVVMGIIVLTGLYLIVRPQRA